MLAAQRRRPRAVRGRPLDAPDGRCGARGRLPARTCRRSATSARPTCCRATRCSTSAPAARARPRSALTRIAAGQHPRVRLEPGDTVIFSAEDHPRQRAHALQPAQPAGPAGHRGDHRGRPLRPRLRPSLPRRARADVPLGPAARSRCRSMARRRHLHAHQRLAAADGRARRRMLIEQRRHAAPGPRSARGDRRGAGRPHGRVETDGLVGAGDDMFRTRRRLMNHGTILVGLVLDDQGSVLAAPQLTPLGAVELERFGELRDTPRAMPSPTRSRIWTTAAARRRAGARGGPRRHPPGARPAAAAAADRRGPDHAAGRRRAGARSSPMEEARCG